MENESKIETGVSSTPTERTGGNDPASNSTHSKKAASPVAAPDFGDPSKVRRVKIEKMKAKLQREIARDNTATRKERNGQLFIWGAMVESVYRDGNTDDRKQLRQWAKHKLTDHRHLKRAENGFARIEDEATENAEATR